MTEGPSPPLQRAKLALPARARSFAAARRPRRAAHTDRAAGALQGAERAAAAGGVACGAWWRSVGGGCSRRVDGHTCV